MARPSRVQALVADIREYCRAHADPGKLEKFRRYFKEGFDAWGLLDKDDPIWIAKKQEWIDGYAEIGLRGCLDAGEELFRSGKYEEGSLAIQMTAAHLDEFDEKSFQRLAKWFEAGIGNWAHTDVLCGELIGKLLLRGDIQFGAMGAWRASPLKYQRRAVPVAMLALLRTRPANVTPLLEFIRPMMLDGERVVQQGLGWFLRESWKASPVPVERFLLEFKDVSPRLIFQYATEKMTPPQKDRFRRTKKKVGA